MAFVFGGGPPGSAGAKAGQSAKAGVEWFMAGPSGGVGGVTKTAAKYGDEVLGLGGKAWRVVKSPFSRKTPKAPKVPTGGVRPNPVQAGDDIVKQVTDNVPSVPAAGRAGSKQFPTPFVVKAGILGGAAVSAPYWIPRVTDPIKDVIGPNGPVADAVGPEGPIGEAGRTITGFTTDLFSSLGGGLANIGAGTGYGVGAGLAGAAEGLKKLALPALLLGGIVVAFLFVSGQAPRRRRA